MPLGADSGGGGTTTPLGGIVGMFVGDVVGARGACRTAWSSSGVARRI